MVRITGGFFKGRQIAVSSRALLRPTQERVREALFSMLADRIQDCAFLDLFAGSGVVALEAWSRGAAQVTMVDHDRRGCRSMRETVAQWMPPDGVLNKPRIVCDDVLRFLRRRPDEHRAPAGDIVFADPPYRECKDGFWEARLANLLVAAGLPARNGLWIMESGARNKPAAPAPWTVVDERIYGDTRLAFYRVPQKTANAGG